MTRPLSRLGLVVNPLAGLGGRAGLGGSDELEPERGSESAAGARAAVALRVCEARGRRVELVTWGGAMGADAARAAGWDAEILGGPDDPAGTTARDTVRAVRALAAAGADLLLVAGGDGTVRDVLRARVAVPVLGVPAGVKMQSAVFARSPRAAGLLLAAAATHGFAVEPREVCDLDEAAARRGRIVPRLHGVLDVPLAADLLQHAKARRPAGAPEAAAVAAGREALLALPPGTVCLVGPGATTRAVLEGLGLAGTLLGVDAVRDGRLIATALDAAGAERLSAEASCAVLLSPTGGQGFLLGRGNQQLSPRVLRSALADGVLIVAGEEKLAGLEGRPLLVDTGDEALDRALAGWRRVLVAPGRVAVYRVAAA